MDFFPRLSATGLLSRRMSDIFSRKEQSFRNLNVTTPSVKGGLNAGNSCIGWFPYRTEFFFRLYFHNCSISIHYCEDRFPIHVLNRSSREWFSYIPIIDSSIHKSITNQHNVQSRSYFHYCLSSEHYGKDRCHSPFMHTNLSNTTLRPPLWTLFVLLALSLVCFLLRQFWPRLPRWR